MANSYKCPNCMGNKTADIGNGVHKCLYCGTVFATRTNEMPQVQQPQNQPPINTASQPQPYQYIPQQPVQYIGGKSKSTAVILGLLIGCFGVARFYVGDTGLGILYLVLTILISIFSLGIGFFVIGTLLCLIDFIYFLSMSEYTFNKKYNNTI